MPFHINLVPIVVLIKCAHIKHQQLFVYALSQATVCLVSFVVEIQIHMTQMLLEHIQPRMSKTCVPQTNATWDNWKKRNSIIVSRKIIRIISNTSSTANTYTQCYCSRICERTPWRGMGYSTME